MALKGKPTT